ncbi:hypothetical protein ES703_42821 [subsurface metagenome]
MTIYNYTEKEVRGGYSSLLGFIEVDPLICPSCGGKMRIIAFIEDYNAIDRIIRHLKLTFATERPPPPQAQPQLAMAAAVLSFILA